MVEEASIESWKKVIDNLECQFEWKFASLSLSHTHIFFSSLLDNQVYWEAKIPAGEQNNFYYFTSLLLGSIERLEKRLGLEEVLTN